MKPKQPRKKLILKRQSIRQLTAADLGKAGGANLPMSPWCMPDPDTGSGWPSGGSW